MLQRLDPDTVATAAAAGDSDVLREFLSKKPQEVIASYKHTYNILHQGRIDLTALWRREGMLVMSILIR